MITKELISKLYPLGATTEANWLRYCREKRDAVLHIKERDPHLERVAELGVHAGYGGHTIAESAEAKEYTGWDILPIDSPPIQHAVELIRRVCSCVGIRHADTQELTGLYAGPFDLVHVDAGHLPKQCFHDMVLAAEALRSGGWLIVDDHNAEIVATGVRMWRRRYKNRIVYEHTTGGITGNYIVQLT